MGKSNPNAKWRAKLTRLASRFEIDRLRNAVELARAPKVEIPPGPNWLRDQLELEYLARPAELNLQQVPDQMSPRKSFLKGMEEGRKLERDELIRRMFPDRRRG